MSSLFFSYSHKDEALRDRLEVHLSALKREGAISTWHDRRILVGDVFGQNIDKALELADIILLLVSPDFLASEYCQDVEMQRALVRQEEGTARVIPVILRPCDWHRFSFGHLLAAPEDGRAITRWPDEDEAFLDVVLKIRDALPKSADRPEAFEPRVSSHPIPAPQTGPRSSNLRLRKQFSDADRDRFLDDAFEFIARFFENSLDELGSRNEGIEGRFKKIDASQFSAVIYERGKMQAQCTIRLGGPFGHGISYSNSVGGRGNSWNDTLSIEHDEQHQFLRTTGMTMTGDRDRQLSYEGAAEHFWSMLIAPLRQ